MQKSALSKTLWAKLYALFCLSLLTAGAASAQCDLTKIKHVTYDTLIVGTANDEYSISLPQFDPSIGTLVSVNLNSTVSLNYGFRLENVEAVQRDFTVQVVRDDYYASSALSNYYFNELDTTIGEFLLNANDVVSKNAYTVLYRYSQNDSITDNVAPFLGNNNVAFDYITATTTNLYGSSQYAFNATANDTVHFSVTYYYCEQTILANNLISFSADKENDQAVKLSWLTTGSQQGINYDVQTGFDDKQFSSIDSVAGVDSTNQYSYDYKIAGNPNGKIYFRLKIVSASGDIKYSDIKEVDISDINASVKALVYPNPASDYINVQLPKADWDIKIYSALGVFVQQDHIANGSLAQLAFKGKLTPGTYFIKAQSIGLNKQQVFQFIVQ